MPAYAVKFGRNNAQPVKEFTIGEDDKITFTPNYVPMDTETMSRFLSMLHRITYYMTEGGITTIEIETE